MGVGACLKTQKLQKNLTIKTSSDPIWGTTQNCLTLKRCTFLKSVFKELSFDTDFVTLGPLKILGLVTPNILAPIILDPIGVETSFDRKIKGPLKGYIFI